MKTPLHGHNEKCLPGWSNSSLSGSVNLRRSPGDWTTKRAVTSVGPCLRIRVAAGASHREAEHDLRETCTGQPDEDADEDYGRTGWQRRGRLQRRVSWALANTTASTLRIARSGGACEIPGKAHIHDSGGKLNYRGGGMDGERCSLPRHGRCESRRGVGCSPAGGACGIGRVRVGGRGRCKAYMDGNGGMCVG